MLWNIPGEEETTKQEFSDRNDATIYSVAEFCFENLFTALGMRCGQEIYSTRAVIRIM